MGQQFTQNQPANEGHGPPERVPQARTAVTRDRIERAAMSAFSQVGFDAASTRDIAARAGVKQQLLAYHYGSKLDLWKAAVDRGFRAFGKRLQERQDGLDGVDEATRIRLLLREFMLFSAEHPEIARFMMHESASPGPRFRWLYDRHTRGFMESLLERIAWAQERGLAAPGEPSDVLYVLLGAVGMFSHSAEAELVTGGRSREPDSLDRYIEFVLGLLLPGVSAPSE
jgi:TetR/AcrR family transcriptional regulator